MNISKSIIATLIIAPLFFFTSCSDDDNASASSGNVTFEITDAPIDNANVSGAFVTVSEVRVDGQAWSGFTGKKTIDLLAYQNGRTEGLGTGELNVGSYSQVELVLDYATDASGNAPGCYIMTTDNDKVDLNGTSSTTGAIAINQSNFDVASSSNSSYVIDFDLRKAIQKGNGVKDYSLKSGAALSAALRAENKAQAGNISGKISGSAYSNSEMVVVYAYEKGQYASSEASGNASTQFQGAVTSSVANSEGDYTLSFLKEGDYELIFCSYEDANNDGEMELEGKLTLDIAGTLDLQTVTVSSSTTATLNITAAALISF
ncbi:MAG: DUF4382 domain-containing protein [Eudoraea sp.]|nr:DUF4382 domain-containing protein [Eudoraea sp.]